MDITPHRPYMMMIYQYVGAVWATTFLCQTASRKKAMYFCFVGNKQYTKE